MKPATLQRSYYPSLDGLRGIAILLVICHHNFEFLSFSKPLWIGVDLFFVLSGFLITDILLRTREQKNFLQNFYIRRALRIFPLYYLMLLLFFLFVPYISQLQEQYKYYHDNQGMTWFHMINWLYIFNQRPENSMVFGHFWSLSVEEQFYILWPFLILLCRNLRKLTIAIYIIIAFGISMRFTTWLYWGGNYTGFSFQYMTRFDGLCVGSLIAVWRIQYAQSFNKKFLQFALAMIGIQVVAFILSRTFFAGLPHFMLIGYTVIAAVFGMFVLSAINGKNNFAKSFLNIGLLRYVGKISYGLYIFHWPVLLFVRAFGLTSLQSKGMSLAAAQYTVAFTSFAVALLLSIVSYELIERRLFALKDVLTSEGYFTRLRHKVLLLMRPASAK